MLAQGACFCEREANYTLVLVLVLTSVRCCCAVLCLLRVRVSVNGKAISDTVPGALIEPGSDNKGAPLGAAPTLTTVIYNKSCTAAAGSSATSSDCAAATITNGNVMGSVSAAGMVTITRVSDSTVLLQEQSRTTTNATQLRASTYYNANGNLKTVGADDDDEKLLTVAINNSAAKCCKSGPNTPCCMDVDNWGTSDGSEVKLSNCKLGCIVPNNQWHHVDSREASSALVTQPPPFPPITTFQAMATRVHTSWIRTNATPMMHRKTI